MTALTDLSVCDALAALRSGQVSSRQLTLAYLERIGRLEPALHAFITLTPEMALAQADLADQRLSAWRRQPDSPPPALLGLPIAVKDVLCVAGAPCTCGSRILEGFVPPYHASVVARLLDAGAVILGKTNTDEFAMGSSTENSAYGVTHNPWNLERVPGGSSGGSAAATAARLAPLALGTDTGGSVRQPASFCGVTGLKPTYGRVSRYGLVAYGSSLDVVGAFARSAADLALVFSLIAGYDPLDATTLEIPVPSIQLNATRLDGLRVGVPEEYFISGIQPQVEAAVRAAIRQLEELGARAVPIRLAHTRYALPVYYLIAPAEASANLARYDGVRYGPRLPAEAMWDVFYRTRGAKFGAEVKRRIMLGTYALSTGYYEAYYGQAQKARTLIRRDFEQAFQQVDVIAAPVAPTTAFAIGGHGDNPLAMYLEDVFTLPANLAGIPGLAFPVGFDGDGLPVGMQLMASHFREDVLFQAAHAYQQATTWHTQTPPNAFVKTNPA
ncbi:MAG: Asp-tRNA(Asn)/Glu-tRNA(Gln) amidotransferase subunit GatA [Chloroflexi bacterium]|nr:Asp-tRNA(Asn)/Glu-tRNA(Gln) amidotransferase subunit GatA [Chloroflexota bacterium]